MPLTPEQIEDKLRALEDRNARLEQLLGSGRSFTNNPLALATDLDDLGSVKTFLDFEELAANPDAPAPGVGRLFARGATPDAVLRLINESGEAQGFVMWQAAEVHSLIRGLNTVTVSSGTAVGTATVTHSVGWTSAGIILATVNNNVVDAGESPYMVHVDTVGVDSFRLIVRTSGNVAANRDVSVAWIADGIL